MLSREEVVTLDKSFLWHPYTPMDGYLSEVDPLVIVRAEGSRLYDMNGRSYIDGNASWWTALLGHRHPRLVRALAEQAAELCHTSLAGVTHPAAAELAAALVRVAPAGLSRVFYSDDGSTAVEVALKLALQYWVQAGHAERRRFLALDGAFHGETLGVTALGGVEVFRRPFAGVLMDCIHVPRASETAYDEAFTALEDTIEKEHSTLAAVVLEPVVQGAAGMRIYPPEYLGRVRELTERHDVWLVLDEVFTGYGRTGPMWATDHAGVVPDMLCLAKGFTGGILPMAATLVSERIFDGFRGTPERAFHYGHTFCGNPLGAAVAREVLAIYRDEAILERAEPQAEAIRQAFLALGALPGVSGTRSLGMIGALDLEGDQGYLARAGWRVYEEALRRGAYLRPLGNTVYVTPPLNIDPTTLAELLGILHESVASVVASGP
jgi:adenosylmethionine-8-amino-7-oxononanoate aminotransferase